MYSVRMYSGVDSCRVTACMSLLSPSLLPAIYARICIRTYACIYNYVCRTHLEFNCFAVQNHKFYMDKLNLTLVQVSTSHTSLHGPLRGVGRAMGSTAEVA